MSIVFISYSSCDRDVAEKVVDYLEGKGIKCWISYRDITTGNFSGEITRALRESDIVLVICSKQSCKSEHVKNEVSIAFNNKKHIIPYLLEDNPFDDDLEYFLSLKQYIKVKGDPVIDYYLLEKFIRDYRGEGVAAPAPIREQVPVPAKKSKTGIIAAVVAAILLAAGASAYYMLRPENTKETVAQEKAKEAAKEEAKEKGSEPVLPAISETKPAATTPSSAKPVATKNTFSGTLVNGYPNGYGKLTFGERRLIDAHDPEERYAEKGDYIKGDWKNGHLNYGEWYGKDGTKKAFIQLGDNPGVGADQKLGQCVKQ